MLALLWCVRCQLGGVVPTSLPDVLFWACNIYGRLYVKEVHGKVQFLLTIRLTCAMVSVVRRIHYVRTDDKRKLACDHLSKSTVMLRVL